MPSGIEKFIEILKNNTTWGVDNPNYNVAPSNPAVERENSFAQYLLTHGRPGPTVKPELSEVQGADMEEPSVLSKTFSALSAPLFGALDLAKEQASNVVDFVQDPGLDKVDDFFTQGAKSFGGATIRGMDDASSIPGVFNIGDLLPGGVKDWAREEVPEQYSSDILGEMGVENPVAKYGGGFVADVAIDPLTYVPGLNILNTIKHARRAKQGADAALTAKAASSNPEAFVKPAAEIVNPVPPVANMALKGGTVPGREFNQPFPKVDLPEDAVYRQAEEPPVDPDFSWGPGFDAAIRAQSDPISMGLLQQEKRRDNAWRAAQVRWGRNPDAEQKALDEAILRGESAAEWSDRMRQHKLAKQGKVSDGKGNVSSVAVQRVIDDIQNGYLPRYGPEPIAATGAARDNAIKKMDDLINKRMSVASGKARTDFNPANQASAYNAAWNAAVETIENTPELAQKFTPSPKNAYKGLTDKQKATAQEVRIWADEAARNGDPVSLDDIDDLLTQYVGNKIITAKDKTVIGKAVRAGFKESPGPNLNSPRARRELRKLARANLRAMEDHAIRLGIQPVFWNGMRVRLSDVLEEVGIEANEELATRVMNAFVTKDMRHIKEPEVAEAINRALARRSLHMSTFMEDISNHATRIKDSVLDGYTQPQAKAALADLPDNVEEVARLANLTNAEINAAKDLVRNVVNVDAIPPEKFMDSLGTELHKAFKEGRLSAKDWKKLNERIIATVGSTPAKLANDISGSKTLDTIATRLTTWFGRGEMKRVQMMTYMSGEMNAVMRARWLRNMVKSYDRAQINAAFRIATGFLPESAANAPEIALSKQFKNYMETMLDSSGMSEHMKQFSVARRSQFLMKDLNRNLKVLGSNFEFKNTKMKRVDGVERDYSGDNWLKSWENVDPKKHNQDPVNFMYDLDLAIERTVKEYALVDDFAMRFGVRKTDPHFDPKVHNARIHHTRYPEDLYFPGPVRDDFQRLLNDLQNNIYAPKSKLMSHYSRGLRAWKTGVTIYMPSHHIRNMIGDLHMTWWAGHNNPVDFIKARRVMHSQRGKYQQALHQDTLDQLKGLVDKDAMEWAKTQGGDVIIKAKNGVQLTADEIYIGAFQRGLLLDANKFEDIFGEAPLGKIGTATNALGDFVRQPLGGKAHGAASAVAEYREHYIRLHHFIAAATKNLKKTKDIQKALDDAAFEVKKWHPDGTDLTQFEQKVRLAIPFYSWTRKAIPLIVEAAATRPAKVLYYPRAMQALQGMMGIEGNGIMDPFPDDQLFPEWIRAKGTGPIGDPESENEISRWIGKLGRNAIDFQGNETGYTLLNPSNPFNDVVDQILGFGGSPLEIGRSIFDSSTPAIKIPGELFVSGEKFSGQPISKDQGGEGVLSYLGEQVPIASAAQNVLELGKEQRGDRESGRDTQALINYLTALGLRGTGAYTTGAEFELKDKLG